MTPPAFSPAIDRFLAEHHMMSLTACADGELWAASVFYCLDADRRALLFYTSPGSTHGRLMLASPSVVATIAAQERDVSRLQGVQMAGTAAVLAGAEAERAVATFEDAFPGISAAGTPIWALAPTYLKMVDNSLGFGHKEQWGIPFPADAPDTPQR